MRRLLPVVLLWSACAAPADVASTEDRGGWLSESAVTDLVFTRDGADLVAGTDDGRIVVVDAHTIRIARELREPQGDGTEVVTRTWFAPRGDGVAWLVESPGRSEMRVAQAATGRSRRVTAANTDARVEAVAFTRDGAQLALGRHDGRVVISGITSGPWRTLDAETSPPASGPVAALAVDPPRIVVARGAWRELTVSGIDGADEGVAGVREPPTTSAWTRRAADVLALESTDAGIVLVARAAAEDDALVVRVLGRAESSLARGTHSVTRVRVAPDGSRVAVQGGDGVVEVFDLADGRREYSVSLDDFAFDASGRCLAGIDASGAAVVVDARDGAPLERIDVSEPDVVTAVALDAGARRLAAGTVLGVVHVWALAH